MKYFKKLLLIPTVLLILIGCQYLFDMKPPEITITSPTDGLTAPNNLVVLEAEVKEDHLKVTELYINGNKRSEYTENNILDSLTLSEGSNQTIKLKAFDKAGNWDEKEVGGIVIPNSLPNIPSAPSGPTSGYTNNTYSFSASTTDPDGDSISYQFEWGDGTFSEWSSYVPSGNSVSVDHSYSSVGTYSIKTKAKDEDEAESDWSSEHEIIISSLNNSPPNNPSEPSGPAGGYVYSTYSFSTSATDPDENNVSYQFDWGDSSLSAWSSSVPSGNPVSMDHSYYSEGTYSIKSKARDEDGAESGWSNGHLITINTIDISPGDMLWSLSIGGVVTSSPAIGDDGTIYVGSGDGNLYAINPNGTEKWTFQTGDMVISSPAIGSDGTIYVGSDYDDLYAINPDGTKKWSFQTGDVVNSSPAIASDGTIYVGSYDKNVYAINPDGTEKWTFQTGSYVILCSPAIASDGTIYVGSEDSNFYAINPDGTEKWAFSTGGSVESSSSIASDGTIYVGSWDGNLYAINPNGTEKWTFETGIVTNSSPAIDSDGTIYVGSYENNVYAVNPDGTEKWTFETGAAVSSSPAIGSDGTIYVGCHDEKVYAINPDGTEKWAFEARDGIWSCPVIGDGGIIYVGSTDNNVYAIYGSSGGLANTPWPMFQHDSKHSGRVGGP